MSKQHPNVKKLREYQRWRRGANTMQPAPAEVGEAIDWAIAVCEAADKFVDSKSETIPSRHFCRLEQAVLGE